MFYLCYTREDALFATQLFDDLTDLGVEVWFDLNQIPPGVDWQDAQQLALEAAEGMILILSPEALQRQHILREIETLWETEKPVYLAVAKPSPWEDWLAGLHFADFTDDYQDGLDSLLLLLTQGDSQRRRAVDPAEAFLRYADRQPAGAADSPDEEDESRQSLLRRVLRRLF